ncbi:MAG: CRISPR-associated protein Cas4 [Candidatus Lokiarchaeota archaeon]|nr:CRISPR-associated protein Cas4 [Candidatus Lokiarchaeota archaeon]
MQSELESQIVKQLRPVFTPEDVRQFVYCPRIIYFRYVLKCRPGPSVKMRKGAEKHEDWRNRQIRQGKNMDRYFSIYLEDRSVGLKGLLDAVDYDGETARPVEMKTGRAPEGGIFENHRAQVVAECLLVEYALGADSDMGILVYEDADLEIKVDLNNPQRSWVHTLLQKMRELVITEYLPRPTRNERKCTDCEFWAYCQRT